MLSNEFAMVNLFFILFMKISKNCEIIHVMRNYCRLKSDLGEAKSL